MSLSTGGLIVKFWKDIYLSKFLNSYWAGYMGSIISGQAQEKQKPKMVSKSVSRVLSIEDINMSSAISRVCWRPLLHNPVTESERDSQGLNGTKIEEAEIHQP